VLEERVRRSNAEGDVKQHLASRHAPRPTARLLDKTPHLFVAWSPKTQLLGGFSDCATDLGRLVRPIRQAFDLVTKPYRDPRREESP
jgi:hypothetical protein